MFDWHLNTLLRYVITEATTRGDLYEMVFLEISQISQENIVPESLF